MIRGLIQTIMSHPKRRTPESSHRPAKTTNIAPKTVLAAPIYPTSQPTALLK